MSKKKKKNDMDSFFSDAFSLRETHKHPAINPVMIGGWPVFLGANKDIAPETIETMDYICSLSGYMPDAFFGTVNKFIHCELQDHGGVPKCWKEFIEFVVGLIKNDQKVLAYCIGGHGRTGTFGASLIAVMEPEQMTPDPIDAIRVRHCHKAVESLKQAEAIFALRGKKLPFRYEDEFKPYKWEGTGTTWSSTSSQTSTSSKKDDPKKG